MWKKISEGILSRPALVIITFLIGLLSGVIQIALSWKDFYPKYLSPEVSIPLWLIYIFILLIILFQPLLIAAKVEKNTAPKSLVTVMNQTYGVQQVELDGFIFVSCVFDGSELVFKGNREFSLVNCTLNATRWKFVDAAGKTLGQLKIMHDDPGLRHIVEDSFNENLGGHHI